ncbi:MAG: zinc ABC transporter substrate-binding protein, partial [Candidatus Puniceispirillaceae bacterium]
DDHGHDKHAKDDHDDHGHDKHAKDDHDDHGHDKHAKDDHDDHGHDKHAKDDHDDHGHDKHAKDDHDDHGHGEYDPHVWLDPINAKAIVHEIEEALVKADPKNAKEYKANADRIAGELDQLVKELRAQFQPVQQKGFIVFHDAYQYFEQRFGVSAIGSITVSPEVMPGAERVSELRNKIRDLKATCIFSEPQFEPKLVRTLVEGTGARAGVLDPLGASLTKGPNLYFQLVREMARSLKECLSAKS